MKKRYVMTALVLCAVLISAMLHAEPTVGKPAPALSAVDASGKALNLADYHGKVVLVNIWASWCAPCLKELPEMNAMAGRLTGKEVVVIAVNIDDARANAERFAKKLNLDKLRIYFDEKKATPKALGVDAMPTSLILDKTGVIRYVNLGYNAGDIEKMEKTILDLLK